MKRNLIRVLGLLLLLTAMHTSFSQVVVPAQDEEVDEEDTPSLNYFHIIQPGDSINTTQRHIPEGEVKKLKENKSFWYADKDFEEKKKPVEQQRENKPYTPLFQQAWFQNMLWILAIAAFAAALIAFLSSSQVGLFSKKKKKIAAGTDEDGVEENIFEIDYQQKINDAERNGNYRMATRLMYLRVLKVMAERNIITYQHEKTNFEYLRQLQGTSYYDRFFRITRHYEYLWYGLFELKEDGYRIIRNDFEEFNNLLTTR